MHKLTLYIFIGLLLGLLCGWIFGTAIIPIAEPLANLFLRLLKMAIMPLILTSIISGVLNIGNAKGLGRLGLKTLSYYVISSLLAIVTGLLLVNFFKPGVGANIGLEQAPQHVEAAQQSVFDIILNVIPDNPIASLAQGDVLPVIFFSIFFGIFVTRINEEQKLQITSFFQGAFDAMLKMTQVIIWTAPLGVFGVNAKIVATTGFGAFKSLGIYFMVVVLGLLIHAMINLPLLLKIFANINPIKHYRAMSPALMTAFSTCSSMVTLPLTIESVVKRSKVSQKIASFILPIGATVNMDGTALYECVATIFIAQVYGIELTILQQVIVVVTALLASIGAASIPMAGLVMMSIILKAVGLPLEGVGIIIAVDRFLDMFRTTTNVLSDSCGAVIVARTEGESLEGIGGID